MAPKRKQSKVRAKRVEQIDPLVITESLGYQTHRKNGRNIWSKEEDDLLRTLIHESLIDLGYDHGIDDITTIEMSQEIVKLIKWEEIASKFVVSSRKGKDLRKRWSGSLDPNLKRGKWSPEEDQQLVDAYNKFGARWLDVAAEIPGRTEDQCAKRYIEVLGPDNKERLRPWTLQEELDLINKVKQYGTKWRKISSEMQHRPSLTCRNRWRRIITTVVRGKASPEIVSAVKDNQSLVKLEDSQEPLETEDNVDKPNQPNDSDTNADKNVPIKIVKQQSVPDFKKQLSPLQSFTSTGNRVIRVNQHPLSNNRHNVHDSDKNLKRWHSSESLTNNQGKNSPTMSPPGLKDPQEKLLGQSTEETTWKFTLKDQNDLSLSNGIIDSSELVKELIEHAKKHSLKISIHQHIHHHYTSPTEAGRGILPEPFFSSQPQTGVMSHLNSSSTLDRYFNGGGGGGVELKNSFEQLDSDFLSHSPSYQHLTVRQSPNLTIGGLGSVTSPNDLNGSNPFTAGYASVKSASSSAAGNDIQQLGPHRVSHFNYLPPTVKPKLGSSDANKMASLTRLLNPTANSCNSSKKIRIKTGQTPNLETNSDSQLSETQNQKDQNAPQETTSKMVEHITDEEGLDFWESLRTLAGGPNTENSENSYSQVSEDYGMFFNILDKKEAHDKQSEEQSDEKANNSH